MTAPLNRGTDPVSQRVYALIFNGVTRATEVTDDSVDAYRRAATEHATRISQSRHPVLRESSTTRAGIAAVFAAERERIAEAVYAELREGGIEIRLADGLAVLRDVNDRLADGDGHASCRRCGMPLSPCATCGKPSQCGDAWCTEHVPDSAP